MDIIRTSDGRRSLAIPSMAGQTDPYRRPIRLVEKAFSMLEFTNQMRRCMTRATTGKR